MRFINKFSDLDVQVQLSEDWVERHWVEDEEVYKNLYYAIRKPEGFEEFLYRQQQGLCCYCLKSLNPDHRDSTIEHIIPQGGQAEGASERELFEKYLEIPLLVFMQGRVCYKQDFNKSSRLTTHITPLPHDLHLLNMVLSCNATQHCNQKRSNTFLNPAYLDQYIEDKIVFLPEGTLYCDDYDADISILGLNHRDLIVIRALWAHRVNAPYFVVRWNEQTIVEAAHLLFAQTLNPIWNDLATNPDQRNQVLQEIDTYQTFEEIYRRP